MKKILVGILALVLMTPMISSVFADESEETYDEDITIMEYQVGAQIRLLQLEKAITKNIIKGEMVVGVLNETGYNTTVLEAILAELEMLKEEVQSADPNSTDAVEIFVDLKSDAVELTKDFRDAIAALLDEQTKEELRERIREMVCEQVQNLSKNIQNHIRQFNRNQLYRLYSIIGLNDTSLSEEYRNGNVTVDQVRLQISKMVNQMTKEKMNQVFSELKESRIRDRIESQICMDNATAGFQERKEARLRNRLDQVQNMSGNQLKHEMENRLMNRINSTISGGDNGQGNQGEHGNGGSNGHGGSGKS